MRRNALAVCLALIAAGFEARAQDAAVSSDAATAVVTGDGGASPGPVDPNAPLPPGHPPTGHGGDPHGGATVRRAELPDGFATEAPGLPPGVVVVRVIDAQGNPQPEVVVRVGAMREGEPAGAQDVRTGPDGVARIEGMITNGSVAYRLSTEYMGARFGAPPFQLPQTAGYQVQIVRHAVSPSPRAVLLWDARAELRFKDDRLVVVMRLKLVNLTAMSLGDSPAAPSTYVPENGLRFTLPQGFTAFAAAPSMSDQRLTEENGVVVLRGSIPPTTREPIDVVFQFQMKLSGGDVDVSVPLPLPVVAASVVTEAPPGLTLSVDGMPAAEVREAEGQRVLLTGLERRPEDPSIAEIKIHLGGIPKAAGPARLVATGAASLLVLGALARALSLRGRSTAARPRAEVLAERDRVLGEMATLTRERAEAEVGPQTYERRRRELTLWLAAVLKELDATETPPSRS